jgi:flagellar biosynthetic protein FliR
VFWWVGEQSVAVPGNLLALGVIAMREVLIGIALGFALSTLTALLTAAGELISSEMGFSMARTINPESGVDASVVSQLLQVLGFLLILQLDLHHDALRILQQTFVACPIGQPFDILPIWEGLRVLVAGTVQLSVQYGFPILGLMLLLSLGMVLLGRAVPAINLQEFGFALRIVLGLGSLAFFLVEGAPFLVHTFHSLLETTAAMFPG